MSKIYKFQGDFSSGELSEEMFSRVDDPKFLTGLSLCENFVPTPQGMLRRRKGNKNMYTVSATDGLLIPFYSSDDKSFVISITDDGFLRAFNRTGILANSTSPDDILLDVSSSEVFDVSAINLREKWYSDGLFHPLTTDSSVLHLYLSGSFSDGCDPLTGNEYNVFEISPSTGRENDDIVLSINVSSLNVGDSSARVNVGTTEGGNELGTSVINSTGLVSMTVNPGGASVVFVSLYGNYFSSSFGDCQQATISIDSISAKQNGVSGGSEVAHFFRTEDLHNIQYEMHPIKDELWLTNGNHQPYIIAYDSASKSMSIRGAISSGDITNPPADWSVPVSLGNPVDPNANFPVSMTFHQGRLWFGGTPSQPNSLYASSANGQYSDFGTPDQTTAATPIELYIASRCEVRWLASSDSLLVGTNIGIYSPESSTGLLQTTDISANFKCGYGVNKSKPIFASSMPVFVSKEGNLLRDLSFTREGQEFFSKEINFENLSLNRYGNFSDLVFSKVGNYILAISGDNVAGCAYNKHIGRVGFFIVSSSFACKSHTMFTDSAGSAYCVLYYDAVSDSLHLCWESDVYMDNSGDFYSGISTNSFTIPHLAGKTVGVIADGEFFSEVSINSSGEGKLPNSSKANSFTAGVLFSSKISTLPSSTVYNSVDNSFSSYKSIDRITVSLVDSTNPVINGYRTPDELSNGSSGYPIQKTKKLNQAANGIDEDAIITIEQNQPYPCNISAIYGSISENKL